MAYVSQKGRDHLDKNDRNDKGVVVKVSYQWLPICHVLGWIIPPSHWQGRWFKWENFEVQLQKEQLEIILVCR
jgi:hypothetical protein